MTLLSIAADILWIVALSIMASASLTAWRRMDPDTRVPMQGDPRKALRLKRDVALGLPIGLTFLFGAVLLWGHRSVTEITYDVIFFGLRATLAAVIAIMHLQWLRGALNALEAEGVLKP
ncbi:hypothetical protein M9M90_00640 [Phenylobacterium sp. LH3H17]|uniref:hypothetical protein n=1 Tax=Phenylobacterium sp. LH3H17 TaxID=2903901 RepID=UPI0020C9E638|nr:hypothetical protein [Phenylobacterium sp. LH3H17]UTP39718.1 hypothetical protein M9M90_00640 [Phenylobacterium sp. LH3H17]